MISESLLNTLHNSISPYCSAIYKGGSRVDPVIEHPHDYDYICFAKPLQRCRILRNLLKLDLLNHKSVNETKLTKLESYIDLSQIRVFPYTQITWFSYLDILMEKVIGEDVCPKTDVIKEHRYEFFKCLFKKMEQLLEHRIKNQKRWYHLLRGIYILINKSYEVTDEQKREINILHDLDKGWEEVREKTITLIQEFKENNNY